VKNLINNDLFRKGSEVNKLAYDEDYPPWFRRRRFPFFRGFLFEDVDEIFKEMERMMEEELRWFTRRAPKGYMRERKLPDGTTVREWGPFVYGYSIKIGPDGKPIVREFGNVRPSRFGPRIKEEREPLVDVFSTDGEIKVVVELPGVEKDDIKLHGTEDTLTISVDTPQRKYYKELKLPAKVNIKDAKTSYKNGVLEVTLPKKEEREPKGEPIKID
jgi:HSP20 family protein